MVQSKPSADETVGLPVILVEQLIEAIEAVAVRLGELEKKNKQRQWSGEAKAEA